MSILRMKSLLILLLAIGLRAAEPATGLQAQTITEPDITYLKVGNVELKLDVYAPARQLGEEPWVRYSEARKPTLLYIHGGGWNSLSKAVRNLNLLPFLQRGWCVVNIDYRLLGQAPFPACIADCRQALNWIYEHADKYKFDTARIVVSGESAGGHLALMTGFLPCDEQIRIEGHPITRPLRVAAIINWYGVSDLDRLMKGWNSEGYTRLMVGDLAEKQRLFQLCSPLQHIASGLPPVISIHGDQDPVVPIKQSILLHRALDKVQVKNRLLTVKGRKHGDFDEKELAGLYADIWKFLKEVGI